MGISDEDYAEAIQKQKQAQQKQMEKQMANTVLTTSGTINANNLTTSTIAGTWAVQEPYGTFKVLSEEDLRHEGMKAPLSALVDMWLARWQGEWVNESEFQEDDFWRIAMIRLTGANKLEKHNLANQHTSVYRIIE